MTHKTRMIGFLNSKPFIYHSFILDATVLTFCVCFCHSQFALGEQSVFIIKVNQTMAFTTLLTFKSKLVEFSGQVIDQVSLSTSVPQPCHPADEVRHHVVDGVRVSGDVFGLQHAGVQDATDALPLCSHPADHREHLKTSKKPQP